MLSVYLCGPLGTQTPEAANAWRRYADRYLRASHFRVLNPMRGKEMLEPGKVIGTDYSRYGEVASLSFPSIFARDTFDVRSADILLANMTGYSGGPSFGSCFEMGAAHTLNIPIVLVAPKDSPFRSHPFIHAAAVVFDTLEEGVYWIIKNFGTYTEDI